MRVAFEEGPKVSSPEGKLWADHLDNHVNLWQKVINSEKKARKHHPRIRTLSIPSYTAHTLQPLTDIWAADNFMQQQLQDILN